MKDIYSYIDQVSNQTFDQNPLNEVDILLFNELTYLPLDEYLAKGNEQNLSVLAQTIGEDLYGLQELNPFLATSDRIKLFELASASPRYQDILVSHFFNQLDQEDEIQICAVTYVIDTKQSLVCFRGTDDSLVGWKEDFKLTYLDVIPAQDAAAQYLASTIKQAEGELIITGHSKGGNLALFAAIQHFPLLKDRLVGLYLFDSPGLNQDLLELDAYQGLMDYTHLYLPEDSIVGRMMYTKFEPIIVKSDYFNIIQHNLVFWKIDNQQLVRAKQTTENSNLIDVTLKLWCQQYSKDELEEFFEYTFQTLADNGLVSINSITDNFFPLLQTMLQESKKTDNPIYEKSNTMLKNILTIWNEERKKLRHQKLLQLKEEIAQRLPNPFA